MNQLHKTSNYLEPMLTLQFEIEADNKTVYNAWVALETFRKWFCPTGFSVEKAEMQPEVGGYFRVHMKSPEGEIYPTKGEYILLDKPNRIVYKDSWDDDRPNNDPIITEVVFEAIGTKTNIKIYSSFATEAQKEKVLSQDVVSGWKMFFNNLNNTVKSNLRFR